MLISLIIPCHGGVQDTQACIASLKAQDNPLSMDMAMDMAMEILVVDNASQDGTAELLGSDPAVRVLSQEFNRGFAGGVNRGLAAATGDYLVVLNNDTLAAPNLLRRLLQPLLEDDRIGIAAPVSNHVKGVACIEVGQEGQAEGRRRELEEILSEHAGGKIQDVDTLSGLCLAFPRSLLRRVGPFDEIYGLGNYEDDDFCLRARLLGYRLVVVRDAYLHHLGHRTFQALGMDYRQCVQEKEALFAEKWRGDPAGQATLALLAGDLPKAARHAREALGQHPAWPDAHFVLARWHQAQGQGQGQEQLAIARLRSFLALCPRHTEAWILLASQLLASEGEEACMSCLQEALRNCYFSHAATVSVLRLGAEWCLSQGDLAGAREHLVAALELEPGAAGLTNLLGTVRMQAGELEAAAALFEQAHAEGEKLGLLNLGVCQWRQGRHSQALESMARAALENPDGPVALQNLNQALDQLDAAGIPTQELRRQVDQVLSPTPTPAPTPA